MKGPSLTFVPPQHLRCKGINSHHLKRAILSEMTGFRLQVQPEYKSLGASSIFCPVECSVFYNMTSISAGTTTMPMITTMYFSNNLCFTKYFSINTYDLLSL